MKFSTRVTDTPTYLFHLIDEKKKAAQEKGIDVVSLAIGDPDKPTPDFVLQIMEEELRDPRNHCYPSYKGEPDFCAGVAEWFSQRFGVRLDPFSEVMAVIGAKDAISHLPFAFLDLGEPALVTDPGYPVYQIAVGFAGGEVLHVPLLEENGFLPDLSSIPASQARKAKIMFINYPNNPTAAVADRAFYERMVAFAQENEVIILSDNAYSEVYFEDKDRPMSIMEIPGAKQTAIEIHSFSKTFNMTGWRVGFVVGGKGLIQALLTLKSNFDSGVFMAIQRTAARALLDPRAQAFHDERTALFRKRRDKIGDSLRAMGFRFTLPRAGYYFWVRIPEQFDSSVVFCADLLEKTGVVVTPGIGYGPSGEHYFRVSMTAPDERIDTALERMDEFMRELR